MTELNNSLLSTSTSSNSTVKNIKSYANFQTECKTTTPPHVTNKVLT